MLGNVNAIIRTLIFSMAGGKRVFCGLVRAVVLFILDN